jgi:RNA polymerase sigma-70 factor (ECF subfamily)
MQTGTVKPTGPAGGEGLVDAARRGDLNAFEELYRMHVGRVYALCLRLAADSAKAEELTQDVFVRLWEKLGSFRGESALSTWLHRVAVNLVFDRMRSEARRSSRLSLVEDLSVLEGPPPPFESGARLDLEKAIALLPPGARAVFVLHDVEGYRHEEIARLLSVAEGTSKGQLHRARRLLREMLQ